MIFSHTVDTLILQTSSLFLRMIRFAMDCIRVGGQGVAGEGMNLQGRRHFSPALLGYYPGGLQIKLTKARLKGFICINICICLNMVTNRRSSQLVKWLKLEAYISQQRKGRDMKRLLQKEQIDFFRKCKWDFQGKKTGYKKVCGKVCLACMSGLSIFSMDMKFPREEIYGGLTQVIIIFIPTLSFPVDYPTSVKGNRKCVLSSLCQPLC